MNARLPKCGSGLQATSLLRRSHRGEVFGCVLPLLLTLCIIRKGLDAMTNMLKRLWKEEEGQGMTEYGLIIALIAVLLIGTLVAFKDKIAAVFTGMKFTP